MNDLFVVFEATPDCDNDCIYCYNVWKNHENKTFGTSNRENSFKILGSIISKIKPVGICFTGGEPLLETGLSELIEFCRPEVKFVSLATNGKNLSEEFLIKNSSKIIDLIDISLPTLREEKYRQICGKDGVEAVKSNIALSKKHGFRINVSITAMKINFFEIRDLLSFAFAFSADSATINYFSPTGRGAKNKKELILSTDEKLELIKIADEFSGKYGLPVIFGLPFERCKSDISGFRNIKMSLCLCGVVKFAVDFEGRVRPCEQSSTVLGNILKDDFKDIVECEELKCFRNDNYSENCISCGHYQSCLGSCRYSCNV
ncbi:radical SAM protein [candidate division WOR-3 bacterium]|nr:radical SAM protein [candidate division WOR-3 bacterium]